MNKALLKWMTGSGVIIIAAIFIVQLYWLDKAFDVQERQFSHTVRIALSKISEQLQEDQGLTMAPLQPVTELSSNFYMVQVKGAIDTSFLGTCIRKEFAIKNMDVEIEYGIYDSATHQMIYGNALSNTIRKKEKTLPVIGKGQYYLGVFFPGKFSHITAAMGVWVISTVLLIVVVIFFSFALFIILKQKRLSEVQKDFVNNMTHEFRTPLATISLSANTLLHGSLNMANNDVKMITEIICKETKRLDSHVEKILHSAHLEKNNIKLLKEKVDLHELIKEVIEQCHAKISKNIRIMDFLEATHRVVWADKLHLTNLILNLLDNAVKYSPYGSEIIVKTENTQGKLMLLIEDQGMGIDRVYRKKVFEPFYRIPTGNLHNVQGFGLGLSYVKNIVKAHRWKINFHDVHPGTCFKIIFKNHINF